jgi:Phage stabilisation protein
MKLALTGGAYTARSVIASAQRSLNLFSEPLPEQQGEPMPVANYPTPGTVLLSTVGSGPIRGIRQTPDGAIYVVSGSGVYNVDPGTWAGTSLGSIAPGINTPVSMQDNGLDLIIVDGTPGGWDVTLGTNAFAPISDPSGMFAGADRVDYLDTYLLFNKPSTPQFYISGSLAITFDPLDFANKESYSDLLVTLCVAKREVWLLGQRTTEIWWNSGPVQVGTEVATFPFSEVQSVFVDHGCAAKYSVANYDNSVFWLTQDRQGHGFVMMGAGYQTQRVSTYAIEAEIAGYATIHDAIGFCYQLAGHTFYVLTFPTADKTWCYDVGTKLWHQWAWIDSNGDEHRHRANCFWPCNDTLVVGDWQNGNLYALRNDVFTDNGGPIKRVRTYPHLVADGRRVFYREFVADVEAGNLGDAETLLSLRWSNDRGHSYGSPVTQSSVSAGQYLTSAQWQRLGMARDRVFEISWTGGGLRALQGAWITAEIADADQPAGGASQ